MLLKEYSFISRIVIRKPLLGREFNNLVLSKLDSESYLKKLILANTNFISALYIASPSLYHQLDTWLHQNEAIDQEVIDKIFKYYVRSHTRSTPFGMFSYCTIAKWSTNTDISSFKYRYSIKYDSDTMNELIKKMNDSLFGQFFVTNDTIYQHFEELRYFSRGHDFKLKVTSIPFDQNILDLLNFSNTPQSYQDIINHIAEVFSDFTPSDVLRELVDNELIIPTNQLITTGKHNRLLHYREYVPVMEKLKLLEKIKVNEIDNQVFLKKAININKDINSYLKQDNLKQNIHLDTVGNDSDDLFIDKENMLKIRKALDINMLISRDAVPLKRRIIEHLAHEIYTRFSQEPVSLLHLFDATANIDYDKIKAEFIKKESADSYKSLRSKLLYTYEKHLAQKAKEPYQLTSDDYKTIYDSNIKLKLGSFIQAYAKFHQDYNKDKLIYCAPFPKTNPISIFSRFTEDDVGLSEFSKELISKEKVIYEDKNTVIAEVLYIEEALSANVTYFVQNRKYYIPILASHHMKILDDKYRILLNDLVVFVRNNTLILFSKSHQKRIIPVISSMYNIDKSTCSIFNFLADLEYQYGEFSGMLSPKKVFPNYSYYPRLQYEDIIIWYATWYVNADKIKYLSSIIHEPSFHNSVNKWLEEIGLPTRVLLCKGDNKLLIDFTSKRSIRCLLDETKGAKMYEFQEALNYSTDNIPHEIFCFLSKDSTNHDIRSSYILKNCINLEQNLNSFPSKEYLYIKIYSHVNNTDFLLKEVIAPFFQSLVVRKKLERWFFIRYNDEEGYHLRIRIKPKIARNEGYTIYQAYNQFLKVIETKRAKGMVNKIVIDTYFPEYNRYGGSIASMELSEKLFYIDSQYLPVILDTACDRFISGLIILLHYTQIIITEVSLVKLENILNEMKLSHSPKWFSYNYFSLREKIQSSEFKKLITLIKFNHDKIKHIFAYIAEESKKENLSIHPVSYINSIFHMTTNRLFSKNTNKKERDLCRLFLGYTQFWLKNQNKTPLLKL